MSDHSDTPELTQQEIANRLWENIAETIAYYNSVSCPCAFPRFRQYAEIDCIDYHGNFYFSETEGFISLSAEHFETDPANGSQRICKKCKSVYLYDWQDFSIHVNRQCMKIVELKVNEIGAPALHPIPFHFGPVGHKNPERSLFRHVELEEFTTYTRELKT